MKPSPADIKVEIDRVRQNKYNQFVKSVRLRNVRGFIDEKIEFRYPVTALIGTNGGGKTTILGSVALSYKNVRPAQFFPKAFVGDESMADWSIEIELIHKDQSPDKSITRTAKFTQSRWRRDDFPERPVEYIEIQRTVPAGEMSKFRRFTAANPHEFEILNLGEDTIRYATAVLDKNISQYKLVRNIDNPDIRMYVGSTTSSIEYSQFHFGAGEASIIETIDRIESAADNSLILIEELENGLHPVAVRLFVQYLQNVAKRKKHQVIFTTHSQDAVDELPPEAIWASINKRTWNGQLSIESLRAITGNTPTSGAIYVEDKFVSEWVTNAIGRYGGGISRTIKVFPAGGYPNLLKVSEFHNNNPLLQAPSVALVDGDIYDPNKNNTLPEHSMFIGEGTPEKIVFDYIYDNKLSLVSIIQQRCLLSAHTVDRIISAIDSVRNSSCDVHRVFFELSSRLDFVSEIHIRDGLIDIFNEYNEEFWSPVIDFIRNKIPIQESQGLEGNSPI